MARASLSSNVEASINVGATWTYRDLGMQDNEEEERQCLVLHPAAGCLMWDGNWNPDAPPTLTEVQAAAQNFGTMQQVWLANLVTQHLGLERMKQRFGVTRMTFSEPITTRTTGCSRSLGEGSCKAIRCNAGESIRLGGAGWTTSSEQAQGVRTT